MGSRRTLVAGLLFTTAGCALGGYGHAPPPDASTSAAGTTGTATGGSTATMTGGNAGTSSPTAGASGASGVAGATGAAGAGSAGVAGTNGLPPSTAKPDFQPRPEFAGPCTRAAGAIDVNLGNRPEDFVRAAQCQIAGTEPAPDIVANWANQLRTVDYVRRVDVVRALCKAANRQCPLTYSDPWAADIPLEPTCTRKTTRDLGAVFMYFSDCPRGVNCGMDWANTHGHGMLTAHPLFAFGTAAANYYNPHNAGYWYRQLLDARWAGLQFFLLNTYGPDLSGAPDSLAMLSQALMKAGVGGVKIALFDDPWSWGQPSSPTSFRTRPNLADTEAAAQAIYTAKWKPFYTRIDKAYWYTFKGKPLIYFYNAGTLQPLDHSAAVVARLKQLFAQDFGVTPFVAVETAYFQDPAMPSVADSQFTWNTLGGTSRARSTANGVTLDHHMVKWDPVGRDKPGVAPTAADHLVKGPSLLSDRLAFSSDADIAVFATWNDLGEGTGIERNYDYYLAGAWSPPTTFMSVTRAAQCAE